MKSQGTSKAGEEDWRENSTIIKIGKKTYLVVPEKGKPNDIEKVLSSAINQAIAQERERIRNAVLKLNFFQSESVIEKDMVCLDELLHIITNNHEDHKE